MAFRYDKFALVLPRIYVLLLLVIYLLFLSYSVYTNSPIGKSKLTQNELNVTWEEYLNNCGPKVIMANSVKANVFYETYYKNNIVTWNGYYLFGIDTDDSKQFFGKGKYRHFIIKMEPSESEYYPDLILSIPYKIYKKLEKDLEGLVKGNKIKFTGVLTKIGDESHLHLLEALEVYKVDNEQKDFPKLRKIRMESIIHMINA